MNSNIIVATAVVMFIASTVRAAFGFGEALISVPLLALILPVQVAAPIAVFVSVVIAGTLVLLDWRHVQIISARRLILSTLFGLPLGIILLKFAPESLVKGVLAAVIFLFSGYSLLRPSRFYLSDDRWAWIFGFFAGIFGGSYGMNGPPLAIYGSLRRWPSEKFRATLQAYFLVASTLTMIGYGLSGLDTVEVNHLFLWSLAPIFGGIVLGRYLGKRLGANFQRIIHVVLLLVALSLIFECFHVL